MIKRLLFLLPVILASACIFWASNQPMPFIEIRGIDFGDKLLHASAYLIYGIALLFGLTGLLYGSNKRKILIISLIVGSIYAASDEIHQFFVPGRSMDFFDWTADFVGIILSLFFYGVIVKVVAKLMKDKGEQH